MTVKRRIERLEGRHGRSAITVLITRFATESGEPKVAIAVILAADGRSRRIIREEDEAEADFLTRVDAAGGKMRLWTHSEGTRPSKPFEMSAGALRAASFRK